MFDVMSKAIIARNEQCTFLTLLHFIVLSNINMVRQYITHYWYCSGLVIQLLITYFPREYCGLKQHNNDITVLSLIETHCPKAMV